MPTACPHPGGDTSRSREGTVRHMGGSAKIVIEGAPAGILTRWPDDRAGVEALARYARLRGIGDPRDDAAGLAQVVQILGNCVDSPSDVMLVPVDYEVGDDATTFMMTGWELTGAEDDETLPEDEIAGILAHIDACQPPRQRLGETIPATARRSALPDTGGAMPVATVAPGWDADEMDDVVPIAPREPRPTFEPIDEDDDLERAWQETLAWASGISVPDDIPSEPASTSDTGGISDTGILRRLQQVTDDEYMMDGFGVNDTGILDAIQYEGEDDELVVMLPDDDDENRPDVAREPVSAAPTPTTEGEFADLDEPDMSDMFTDTGTLIVMKPVPAPESTGEIVIVPTDVEGTVMTSSDEQATQPLPEQGIPFSDVTPDDTARNIIIPLEAPEIGPNLSTEETARNPLPYPEVMDAEFEPFVDEGKGTGKKKHPKRGRKTQTKGPGKGEQDEKTKEADEVAAADRIAKVGESTKTEGAEGAAEEA